MEELSKEMRLLFKDYEPPTIKLIESIHVLGLSVKSLRSKKKSEILLENGMYGKPEAILQYPP